MQLFEVEKLSIPKDKLSDRYVVPPFSVFNTHQPYFKEKAKFWYDAIGDGREGRAERLAYDNRRMDKRASAPKSHNGTSMFNPVVCEVVYKWFTVDNSMILDPFAGGVVRGAVASMLGHSYIGYDLSVEQVNVNRDKFQSLQQRFDIKGDAMWLVNDAELIEYNEVFDLVFSCPPFYNLEKYSDNPADLSNLASYSEFLMKYIKIIEKCVKSLKNDSFAVFVVSEVRDKQTGEYYGLVADTIKAFQQAGMKYYNEIILYNETGNLAIVSGDYINKARKVGRQHQNILVFYKGDTKNISVKFKKLFTKD